MRRISEVVKHAVFVGAGAGAHGNKKETWAAPTDLGIYAFNPASSREVMIDGHMHRVETKPTIYVPLSASVGPRDRIIRAGVTYSVDGVEAEFRNPYDASMDGVSIVLRAVTG